MLLAVLFAGCSAKPNAVTKDALKAQDLKTLMWDSGLSSMTEYTLDSEYGLPTEGWITDILYPALFNELKKDGLWRYAPESNDCDDFAARARLLANKLNNLTENSGKRGIAFGEYHYIRRDGGAHALNFAIVKTNNSKQPYKLVFFEPQTSKIVYLTEKEIESVMGWIL